IRACDLLRATAVESSDSERRTSNGCRITTHNTDGSAVGCRSEAHPIKRSGAAARRHELVNYPSHSRERIKQVAQAEGDAEQQRVRDVRPLGRSVETEQCAARERQADSRTLAEEGGESNNGT